MERYLVNWVLKSRIPECTSVLLAECFVWRKKTNHIPIYSTNVNEQFHYFSFPSWPLAVKLRRTVVLPYLIQSQMIIALVSSGRNMYYPDFSLPRILCWLPKPADFRLLTLFHWLAWYKQFLNNLYLFFCHSSSEAVEAVLCGKLAQLLFGMLL